MSAIAKGLTRIDSDLVREALDRAPVGIAVLSTDGIFRFANRALCEMMGYPRSALEGQSYSAFVPAAELASDEEHLRTIRKGGAQLWVRVSATVIRDPSNEARYIVSAIVDLSEQREKDRSLRQTNSFL